MKVCVSWPQKMMEAFLLVSVTAWCVWLDGVLISTLETTRSDDTTYLSVLPCHTRSLSIEIKYEV